ncbi:MAG: DUF1566 domain-containing protein [Campylobacterales bacterium]|nr:DUF1566 domain-containing protein [Campylobacterales bacterium]
MRNTLSIFFAFTALATASFIPQFGGHGKGVKDESFVRDNNKSIVTDTTYKRSYSDIKNTNLYTFEEATAYCAKFQLAGYSDWRVPNKDELKRLFDFKRKPVRIKTTFVNTAEGRYWSSTEANYNKAYYISFDLGRYSRDKKTKKYYVMCVRDGK